MNPFYRLEKMMSMTACKSPSIGGAWLMLPLVFLLLSSCSPSAPTVESDKLAPSAPIDESGAVTPTAPEGDSAPPAEDGPPVATEDVPPVETEDGPPELLPDAELADGWISLFDGQSLFGWTSVGDADWRVEEGAIVVETGENCLLCTTSQFADYVLRVDFRCEPSTNSGVFLHTPLAPEDPATDCYELNIAGPENPFPTGSLVGRQKTEIHPVSDEWHSYEVTLDGADVTVLFDGKEILQYTDPQPLKRGHIGLQLNQGKIAFRNVRLKPLGAADMLNGRDLTGWTTYPDMASKFTVTDDGLLNVQDGRGQLESKASYADFVLQLQCKTEAEALNSGVFFRCIPGDVMMGYECQIHNGFVDGDRKQPQDCGSGGIFRRQDARRVVADDLTWFSMTLVADGPHMAAWVNGYQVSDWTDDRPPHENPRKGLRLEPGTIMIQGHDPTTNLFFRDLRIAELPGRNAEGTAE